MKTLKSIFAIYENPKYTREIKEDLLTLGNKCLWGPEKIENEKNLVVKIV